MNISSNFKKIQNIVKQFIEIVDQSMYFTTVNLDFIFPIYF